MANSSECQIAALQNIVRIQDDIIKGSAPESPGVVWRNEAYKLSVQNQILQDECVAIAKELIASAEGQRMLLKRAVLRSVENETKRVTALVNQRMETIENQVKRLESKLMGVNKLHKDEIMQKEIRRDPKMKNNPELIDVLNDLKSLEREARDLLIKE